VGRRTVCSRPSMNTLRGATSLKVAIRRPVVTLHQVQRLDRRDRPTAFSQPVAKIRALLDEPTDQECPVRCLLGHRADIDDDARGIRVEEARARGLDRDAAAGGAEFYDPLEQQILAGRR